MESLIDKNRKKVSSILLLLFHFYYVYYAYFYYNYNMPPSPLSRAGGLLKDKTNLS
jgi:uncharacterized membrane protein